MTPPPASTPRRDNFRHGCMFGIGGGILAWIVAWMVLPPFNPERKWAPPSCANQLKQMGLSLMMYANQDPQRLFPPISVVPGKLTFDREVMTNEFLPDPGVQFCPFDNDPEFREAKDVSSLGTGDWSYLYTGYALRSDADVEAFAGAYKKCVAGGPPLNSDLEYTDEKGQRHLLLRFKEREQNAPNTPVTDKDGQTEADIHSTALVIERLGNHTKKGNGANVLFLDNHVEYIRYPGKWPMTPETVRLLQELDDLGKRDK